LKAPDLPHAATDPVFAEPWQAQAFALAVTLSEAGHFTWKEWADALAGELKRAAERGEPAEKGLADPAHLDARKAAWAEAYRATPHGKPVELK
jgi:nitrile hydratase accessory protein